MFSSPYPNNSRVVSGAVTLYSDDVFLLCDTSISACTIPLDPIPSGNINIQYRLYVKDGGNNASANNIVITPPSGSKINNLNQYIINQNGASIIIIPSSNTDYITFSTSTLNTKVFANTADRLASVPDFVGQLGVQIDTDNVYTSIGLTAGAWSPLEVTTTFADATARAASIPLFIGQVGVELDTNTAYTATGLIAGAWTIISSSGSTYTNPNPTPVTLGGIPAGSTFLNQTLQQMFDQLLYPYQSPSFTSFQIAGQASPLEVGDSVAGGTRTMTWSTSNPTNINPNSIALLDITGATTLASGLANTGSNTLNIGSPKTLTSPGSYVWQVQGTNSNSILFTRNYSVNWQYRKFYGTSALTILNGTQIQALVSNPLSNSIPSSYGFAAGDYKYLAFPDSFGAINTITFNGFGVAMADASDGYALIANGINYALVSVTNGFGVTTNYKLYRTKFSQVSAQIYIVT